MNRLISAIVMLVPALCAGKALDWDAAAPTYQDVVDARRESRPLPVPPAAPVLRVVDRRDDGTVLVETRYPLGGVTTNARKSHVIYRAKEVAADTTARVAYDAAVARLMSVIAVAYGASKDAGASSAAALLRQAERVNAQAAKIEKDTGKPDDKRGGSKTTAVAVGGAVALAAAYAAGRKTKGAV